MKKYIFSIDGHEDDYFLAQDVRSMFQGEIYREDVRAAVFREYTCDRCGKNL